MLEGFTAMSVLTLLVSLLLSVVIMFLLTLFNPMLGNLSIDFLFAILLATNTVNLR